MKKLALIMAVAISSSLTGCVTYMAPVMPPPGLFFSDISAPIDTDANPTAVGSKTGASTSTSVLFLFAFGDASVASAAANGGITKIDHVDYEYRNLLFFFQQFTTVVHGE